MTYNSVDDLESRLNRLVIGSCKHGVDVLGWARQICLAELAGVEEAVGIFF